MNNQEQQRVHAQPKDRCEEMMKMIQCGDLVHFKPVQYALIMMGKTKAGKTTLAHYLSGGYLQAVKDETHGYKYSLKHQYDNKETLKAQIGMGRESQTQIPNEFKKVIGQLGLSIIDSPGYLDSFGFQRIISNGYFHYRTFSNVKNVKFLIVVDYYDMLDHGMQFFDIFSEFINNFDRKVLGRNQDNIQQKIFDCCSLMINKIPNEIREQGAILNFVQLKFTKKNKQLTDLYKKFRDSILRNDIADEKDRKQKQRIYCIFKPRNQEDTLMDNGDLCKKINQKCQFWHRDINNGVPDMTIIKTSIHTELKKRYKANQYFKEGSDLFAQQFQNLIAKMETIFKSLLQLFINDTFQYIRPNQASYVQNVRDFIDQKYQKIEQLPQNNVVKKLDKLFKPKMDAMMETLFTESRRLSTDSKKKSFSSSANSSLAILDRVKIAQQLFSWVSMVGIQNENLYRKQKGAEALVEHANSLKTILNQMINMIQGDQDLIKMFLYEIHEFFQMCNNFYQIIEDDYQDRDHNVAVADNHYSFVTVYPKFITSIANSLSQSNESIEQKKIKSIQNLNINLIKPQSYTEFIVYLQQLRENAQQDINTYQQQLKIIQNKLMNLYSQHNYILISQLRKRENCHPQIIYNTLNQLWQSLRISFQIYENSRRNAFEDQDTITFLIQNLNRIGQCLEMVGKQQQMLSIWMVVFNGHKILQFFQKKASRKESLWKEIHNLADKIHHLKQYSEYAHFFGKKQLALGKAYEALYLSQQIADFKEMNEIRKLLAFIRGEQRYYNYPLEDFTPRYQEWLRTGNYIIQIPQDLTRKIQSFIQTHKQ